MWSNKRDYKSCIVVLVFDVNLLAMRIINDCVCIVFSFLRCREKHMVCRVSKQFNFVVKHVGVHWTVIECDSISCDFLPLNCELLKRISPFVLRLKILFSRCLDRDLVASVDDSLEKK